MTDKYLCESLGNYLQLPVYYLYKKVCGFVHYSSDSFHSISNIQRDSIVMLISRKTRDDDEKNFTRLSLELANHFYFFGVLLIETIFKSWLEQKKNNN